MSDATRRPRGPVRGERRLLLAIAQAAEAFFAVPIEHDASGELEKLEFAVKTWRKCLEKAGRLPPPVPVEEKSCQQF